MTLEKTEIKGLYKDDESGALLNKDNSGLAAYKQKKMQSRKIKNLESRLRLVEDKIDEIITKINSIENQ